MKRRITIEFDTDKLDVCKERSLVGMILMLNFPNGVVKNSAHRDLLDQHGVQIIAVEDVHEHLA